MPDDPTVVIPAHAPAPETFSKDYVRELREENKGWRLKASEHETAAKAALEAVEKVKVEAEAKVTEATTSAQARVIRAEIKAAAIKAGMIDLDGLKMLDLSGIKLNEAGDVEGAEALLDAAKKAKPYLFGDAKTSSTMPPPKPKEQTEKTAKEMTDAELRSFEKQHGIRL
ncbi:MAG: hypothetical protein P4L10_10970 [Acidobacteriaceae bacterium]|nr:hypothetical protein [Acidobacteriaceae bacterium]